MSAPRRIKKDIHGWFLLDKPVGMTSTQAVSKIKWAFQAKKVGHAGTLDPLASGCLPIALGEATKTVPYVMDGRKIYRFAMNWGAETTTDDLEGPVVATSDKRPTAQDIEGLIPRFLGVIKQIPPQFSAIKINGNRAYDLARCGEEVALEAREIMVNRLDRVGPFTPDVAEFEIECGKGTYVRAIARDMGRMLGCYGHVSALRRVRVGGFQESDLISLDEMETLRQSADGGDDLCRLLLPVETALADIPALAVSSADAARLRRGQAVLLRGRDAPLDLDTVYVKAEGSLIALARVEAGALVPHRVFNLATA